METNETPRNIFLILSTIVLIFFVVMIAIKLLSVNYDRKNRSKLNQKTFSYKQNTSFLLPRHKKK